MSEQNKSDYAQEIINLWQQADTVNQKIMEALDASDAELVTELRKEQSRLYAQIAGFALPLAQDLLGIERKAELTSYAHPSHGDTLEFND